MRIRIAHQDHLRREGRWASLPVRTGVVSNITRSSLGCTAALVMLSRLAGGTDSDLPICDPQAHTKTKTHPGKHVCVCTHLLFPAALEPWAVDALIPHTGLRATNNKTTNIDKRRCAPASEKGREDGKARTKRLAR